MIEDFEKEFLDGLQMIHIELDLLKDQWDELKNEFQTNEWPDEEGLRFVLAAGLRAIQNQKTAETLVNDQTNLVSELERLQTERMYLDGRYAVMKFRTYQFMQACKTLEWKLNVSKFEMKGLEEYNQKLRSQLKNQK
jgi:hypothetical protein